MAVYVDDQRNAFGRMIMCHMIATTEEELVTMADALGLKRSWHQYPDTYKSHYDVSLSVREKAIRMGAIPITWREMGRMLIEKRKKLHDPIYTP